MRDRDAATARAGRERIVMSSRTSRVFRNIASNWVAIGVNLVLSFFLAPFVVNSLGANLYGIWAVAMQFTGYLYLMDFGVRDSLIRYTAKYRTTGNDLALGRILSVALLIYVPVFLCAMLVTAGVAYAFPYVADIGDADAAAARTTVFLVGASISSTFLFNIYSGLLQGLQRFDVANALGIFIGVLRAGLVVWVLSSGYGIVGLAWMQLGVTVLGGVLTFFMAQRLMTAVGLSLRPRRVSGRKLRALLRLVSGYSIYVFINNIGQKLIFASDAIVISIFMPIAAVTYYAIAGNLIEYLRTLVAATAQVFNPLASEYAARHDQAGLRMLLLRSTRLMLIVGLPVIAAYVMLGEVFIGLWMGPEYALEAGVVLVILALTQILSCPHNSVASILYGIGKHRTLAFMRVGEAVANVILSVALVGPLGIKGVALGTAIPHVVVIGVLLPLYACRLLGISWWTYVKESLTGPLLNMLPFLAGAWLIKHYAVPTNLLEFFAIITGLTVLYLITGYGLSLRADERAVIRSNAARLLSRFSRASG